MTAESLLVRLSVLLFCLFPSLATGQDQFDGVELSSIHVAGSVYMIQRPGGGGNVGAMVGPEGVLLVDSLFAPLSDKLVAAVQQVSDAEIRFLINTHIHIDHIGGNQNLAEMGVLIFASDNTRHRFLEQRNRFPRNGGTFIPAQPEAARPVVTFNDRLSFHLNGEEIQAFLVPPAHTDGDIFVYFPQSDVLHLGDVYRTTSYPIIDVYNGGSLAGTVEAINMAIRLAGPDTKVIPGHGLDVVGREALKEFRDMIVDIQDQVLNLIRDGKNLEEVIAARPTAEYDAEWTSDPGWGVEDFLPVVYSELGGSGRLQDR
ncbi:MBL fold metallo-hydrolase [Pseudohongiella sp. O18]|uniref:MBL fold metallo-hydrolase n=1 Tax=Pseudohongiella sp. O18 TaxID=2904248 RepID=UPI001F2B0ECD|nr:MBL fold metallo-hydrolase [Pseudohongiella sp. O18]